MLQTVAWGTWAMLVAWLGTGMAAEIAADQLPKAIVDRIHARLPSVEIRGAEETQGADRDRFVVEVKGPNGPFHMTMSAGGAIRQIAYEGKSVPGQLAAPVERRFAGAEILYAIESDDSSLQSEASVYLRREKHNMVAGLSFGGGMGGWRIFSESRQISENELPKKVLQAIRSKYPKATVRWAESVSTTQDLISLYEVWLTRANGKTVSMSISPDGEMLDHGESGTPPAEEIFSKYKSDDGNKN